MDDQPRSSLDTRIWTPGCRSIPWVSAIVKAREASGIVSLRVNQRSEPDYAPLQTLSAHNEAESRRCGAPARLRGTTEAGTRGRTKAVAECPYSGPIPVRSSNRIASAAETQAGVTAVSAA